MILLTTLYDEYIDQPELTERKNHFNCIVPPQTKLGRYNEIVHEKQVKILKICASVIIVSTLSNKTLWL